MSIESVKLAEIISEKNRLWTRDDGFKQLKESVKEHGILEPPLVRRLPAPETGYRTVAGRRRIAALREINEEEGGTFTVSTECVVIAADDPRSDEEIALTENVNRLDMHPLDEAALFSGMAQKGITIERIAERYARSKSAIYKRLRLSGLVDELKGLFRDDKINIAAAAVLAELPEEDQKDFFKQYEKKEKIEDWDAYNFVNKKQKFIIRPNMKKACEGCKKRTHNKGNELFEECDHLSDVCLDSDCYRLKWYEMLSGALAKEHRASEVTDGKIYFYNGIPEMLYKKASKVKFKIGKTEIEFEVLREKDYEFTGESKKKTGCCWKIMEDYAGNILVRRVGYKKKEPQVRSEKSSDGDVERYGKGVLKAVAAELYPDKTAEELAGKLEAKGAAYYQFENVVKDKIFEHVVSKRIEEEKTGARKPRDYFSMFLIAAYDCCRSNDSFIENKFSVRQKEWQKVFLGGKSLKQIADGLDEETQKLFHFLLLSCGLDCDLPDINQLDSLKKKKFKNDFLEYSGLSADEYKELYIEFAKEAAAEALEPKKKKAPVKKKKTAGERKCRVCGCTENDCRQCIEKTGSPCHWVEDDLCSACVAEAEDEQEAEDDPF